MRTPPTAPPECPADVADADDDNVATAAAPAAPSPGAAAAAPELAHEDHAGIIRVIAAACALSVANLYLNQPLLAEMARTFGVDERTVGTVPMMSQVGYAIGLLLIVPLGDILQRRSLITALLGAVTLSLIAVATSRNFAWLAVANLAVGVSTVVPQVLLPFAAQLSRPERRGRAVGTVMLGLLLGILLSRTASGLIADRFGWRAVYWTFAGTMVLLAAVLRPLLPRHDVHVGLTYGGLLRSVWEQVARYAELRRAMLNGALLFAAFSAFWATLVFRLEASPLHYGARVAGMFGLIGAAGAMIAPLVGRWADRVGPRALLALSSLGLLASFGIFWLGGSTLWGIAAGVIVLDMAMQATQVTNMTRIYGLSATAHSRVNSAYMVTYFVGGAAGSMLGALAWDLAGWAGVCVVGAVCSAVALLLHLAAPKAVPAARSPSPGTPGEVRGEGA